MVHSDDNDELAQEQAQETKPNANGKRGRPPTGHERGERPHYFRTLFNQPTMKPAPYYSFDPEDRESAPLLNAAFPSSLRASRRASEDAEADDMQHGQEHGYGGDDEDVDMAQADGTCGCAAGLGAATTRRRRAERKRDDAVRQEAAWVSGKYKAMRNRLVKVAVFAALSMATATVGRRAAGPDQRSPCASAPAPGPGCEWEPPVQTTDPPSSPGEASIPEAGISDGMPTPPPTFVWGDGLRDAAAAAACTYVCECVCDMCAEEEPKPFHYAVVTCDACRLALCPYHDIISHTHMHQHPRQLHSQHPYAIGLDAEEFVDADTTTDS